MHGKERAAGEVGDLHRRHRRRGVGEHTGAAEVVEVVARVARVRAVRRRSR